MTAVRSGERDVDMLIFTGFSIFENEVVQTQVSEISLMGVRGQLASVYDSKARLVCLLSGRDNQFL